MPMEKTKNFVVFAVCCSHKPFIFRVFGVFRGLSCPFQPSLSVSIRVHSPRCRAVAAGPWLTLLPLVLRLEVLMFRVDRPWLQCHRRAMFCGVPNRSMVPCQVHGGTILLPLYPELATRHSHYCECLYCPDVSETGQAGDWSWSRGEYRRRQGKCRNRESRKGRAGGKAED